MLLDKRNVTLFVVAWVVFVSALARGDVFSMGSGLTNLEFVPVRDAGNAPDVPGGSGAVDYVYNIGKFEVTCGQYTEFLNAVARTEDTYGLYEPLMASFAGCGITQEGGAGDYTYSVPSACANRPVVYVSWGDAARFANWLHNGQPIGNQTLSTTENGAYFLNGATANSDFCIMPRTDGARYFIPSWDEWSKAAYYKGGGTDQGYWTYPTQSDHAPICAEAPPGQDEPPGSVNCPVYDQEVPPYCFYADPVHYTTEAGAYADSPGPYGTFDQGGNVWEWTEHDLTYGIVQKLICGGSWNDVYDGSAFTARSTWGNAHPNGAGASNIGFRVATSVPEPRGVALMIAAVVAIVGWGASRRSSFSKGASRV